jgi:hypothetical protein
VLSLRHVPLVASCPPFAAIVKLSSLTVARTVYRGYAGAPPLPDALWMADSHNAVGGVEASFLSATHERHLAVACARARGVGVLLEIRQGRLSRGACLSWLSQVGSPPLTHRPRYAAVLVAHSRSHSPDGCAVLQYPHELEMLFPPMTCVEPLGTRVDGTLLVVEARLTTPRDARTIDKLVEQFEPCACPAPELQPPSPNASL